MGTLEILNVGHGDVKISYDHSNAAEAIRAKRIIQDMLKRGYALLVELPDGTMQRVKEFDPERGEYIIADFDSLEAAKADAATQPPPEPQPDVRPAESGLCVCGRPARHRGACKGVARGRRRLPMASTRVTAVAPSAGG